MRIIAFVTQRGSIKNILAYLGEPMQAPHIAQAARGPAWEKDFESRESPELGERAAAENQGQGVALLSAPHPKTHPPITESPRLSAFPRRRTAFRPPN
jgi:hypothetical protein